jgi:hypothetical protein
MMCIGDRFAVVCLASIDDKKERKSLAHAFIAKKGFTKARDHKFF